MLSLPLWLSGLISVVAKVVTQFIANRDAQKAMRDLGAATQANESLLAAERQELEARAAGAAAVEQPDDPRDLRD